MATNFQWSKRARKDLENKGAKFDSTWNLIQDSKGNAVPLAPNMAPSTPSTPSNADIRSTLSKDAELRNIFESQGRDAAISYIKDKGYLQEEKAPQVEKPVIEEPVVDTRTDIQKKMDDFIEQQRQAGAQINEATGELINPTQEQIDAFNREFTTTIPGQEKTLQDVQNGQQLQAGDTVVPEKWVAGVNIPKVPTPEEIEKAKQATLTREQQEKAIKEQDTQKMLGEFQNMVATGASQQEITDYLSKNRDFATSNADQIKSLYKQTLKNKSNQDFINKYSNYTTQELSDAVRSGEVVVGTDKWNLLSPEQREEYESFTQIRDISDRQTKEDRTEQINNSNIYKDIDEYFEDPNTSEFQSESIRDKFYQSVNNPKRIKLEEDLDDLSNKMEDIEDQMDMLEEDIDRKYPWMLPWERAAMLRKQGNALRRNYKDYQRDYNSKLASLNSIKEDFNMELKLYQLEEEQLRYQQGLELDQQKITEKQQQEYQENAQIVNKDMSALQGYYIDGNGNPIISKDTWKPIPIPTQDKEAPMEPIFDKNTGQLIQFSYDENGKIIATADQVYEEQTVSEKAASSYANLFNQGKIDFKDIPEEIQEQVITKAAQLQEIAAQQEKVAQANATAINLWDADVEDIANYSVNKRGRENLQCGELVNDYWTKYTWARAGMWDTLESKISAVESIWESDVPVAGGVFVSNPLNNSVGHTGIVQTVNPDGSITVLEANADGLTQWQAPILKTYSAEEASNMMFSVSPKEKDLSMYTTEDYTNMIVNMSWGLSRITDDEREYIESQVPWWIKKWYTPREWFLRYKWFILEKPDQKNMNIAQDLLDISDNFTTKPSGFEVNVSKYINNWDLDGLNDYINNAIDDEVSKTYKNDAILHGDLLTGFDRATKLRDLIIKNQDKIWPVAGRASDLLKKLKWTEDYQQIQTLLQMSQAELRKYFAGSAVTETEMKALEDFIGGTTKMNAQNLVTMIDTLQVERANTFNNQRAGMDNPLFAEYSQWIVEDPRTELEPTQETQPNDGAPEITVDDAYEQYFTQPTK